MATHAFLYCCPITGHKVQGVIPDAPAASRVYQTLTCAPCAHVHLVNPTTDHVAGISAHKPTTRRARTVDRDRRSIFPLIYLNAEPPRELYHIFCGSVCG